MPTVRSSLAMIQGGLQILFVQYSVPAFRDPIWLPVSSLLKEVSDFHNRGYHSSLPLPKMVPFGKLWR